MIWYIHMEEEGEIKLYTINNSIHNNILNKVSRVTIHRDPVYRDPGLINSDFNYPLIR